MDSSDSIRDATRQFEGRIKLLCSCDPAVRLRELLHLRDAIPKDCFMRTAIVNWKREVWSTFEQVNQEVVSITSRRSTAWIAYSREEANRDLGECERKIVGCLLAYHQRTLINLVRLTHLREVGDGGPARSLWAMACAHKLVETIMVPIIYPNAVSYPSKVDMRHFRGLSKLTDVEIGWFLSDVDVALAHLDVAISNQASLVQLNWGLFSYVCRGRRLSEHCNVAGLFFLNNVAFAKSRLMDERAVMSRQIRDLGYGGIDDFFLKARDQACIALPLHAMYRAHARALAKKGLVLEYMMPPPPEQAEWRQPQFCGKPMDILVQTDVGPFQSVLNDLWLTASEAKCVFVPAWIHLGRVLEGYTMWGWLALVVVLTIGVTAIWMAGKFTGRLLGHLYDAVYDRVARFLRWYALIGSLDPEPIEVTVATTTPDAPEAKGLVPEMATPGSSKVPCDSPPDFIFSILVEDDHGDTLYGGTGFVFQKNNQYYAATARHVFTLGFPMGRLLMATYVPGGTWRTVPFDVKNWKIAVMSTANDLVIYKISQSLVTKLALKPAKFSTSAMAGVVRCYSYQGGQWYYSIGPMSPHAHDARYVSLRTDSGNGGASGGPLLRMTSSGLRVVGIHLGRNLTSNDNYGTLVPDPFEKPRFLPETTFRDKYGKLIADFEGEDFGFDVYSEEEVSYEVDEGGLSFEDYFIPDQGINFSYEDDERIRRLENEGVFSREQQPVEKSRRWADIMSEESREGEAGKEVINLPTITVKAPVVEVPVLASEHAMPAETKPLNLEAPPQGGAPVVASTTAVKPKRVRKKKNAGATPVSSLTVVKGSSPKKGGASAAPVPPKPSEPQPQNKPKDLSKKWVERQRELMKKEAQLEIYQGLLPALLAASGKLPVSSTVSSGPTEGQEPK